MHWEHADSCIVAAGSRSYRLHMTVLVTNIKMDRIPTKIKRKLHALFTLYFKFEGASYKNL